MKLGSLHVHDISNYLTCRKKFELSAIEKLESTERVTALEMGIVWHELIYHRNKKRLDFESVADDSSIKILDRIYDPMLSQMGLSETRTEVEIEKVKLWAMFTGYEKTYKTDDWAVKVIHPEMEFDMPILSPKSHRSYKSLGTFGGRIDSIVKWEGRLWLIEYKTASTFNGIDVDRLDIDDQITAYVYAVNRMRNGIFELEQPVAGVIYDVVIKPLLRQKSSENLLEYEMRMMDEMASNPDRYYRRIICYISEERQKEFEAKLWDIAREIRKTKKGNRRYHKNPSVCIRGRSVCEYLSLCRNVPGASSRYTKKEA